MFPDQKFQFLDYAKLHMLERRSHLFLVYDVDALRCARAD